MVSRGVARPNTLLKETYFEKYTAKGDHSYIGKSTLSCHFFKKVTTFVTFSLLS